MSTIGNSPPPPQFSPPPRVSVPPANTPSHSSLLDNGSPLVAPSEEEIAAMIQQLQDIGCCSETSARRALVRCKNDFDQALDELIIKKGFVLIVVSFCAVQVEYTKKMMRNISLYPCFLSRHGGTAVSDNINDPFEVNTTLLDQRDIQPYFITYEEFLPYAKSQDWEAFYNDFILNGDFSFLPPKGSAHAPVTGGIVGVVTSTDCGAPLVDYLNERLFGSCREGTFGNPFSSSERRQCKFAMHDCLRASGLDYIKSMNCRTAEECQEFCEGIFAAGDLIIVKPSRGAGSEFVTLCKSIDEVKTAFTVAEGLTTTQHVSTEWMVVQEFIDGEEYVVDTVSYQSNHIITDVWTSVKIPFVCVSNRMRSSAEKELKAKGIDRPAFATTSLLYDKLDFVSNLDGEVTRDVVQYTLSALNALELINGCAHCELRVRKSTGKPVLIELNPRMQGDTPRSTNLVGYDQYILMAYLAFVIADRLVGTPSPQPSVAAGETFAVGIPQLYRPLHPEITRRVLFLRASNDGYVAEVGRKFIQHLPTFVSFTRSVISEPPLPGFISRVKKTTDLYSCPAAIILEGSPPEIDRDESLIRTMENDLPTSSGWLRLLREAKALCDKWKKAKELASIADEALQRLHRMADCADELSDESDHECNGGDMWRQGTGAFHDESEEGEDLSDEAVEGFLAAPPFPFTVDELSEKCSIAKLLQVSKILTGRVAELNKVSYNAVRNAKTFLARMSPPPLFISTSEWEFVYGGMCGGALGG